MTITDLLTACRIRVELHRAIDADGRTYAGRDPIAHAVIDLIGGSRGSGFEPPVVDPGMITILDGSEDPEPAYQFTPSEARGFAADLLRAADEAESREA